MNLPSTESKPLRERLIPQTSIRFYLLLIGASAVVMYIYRAAFVNGAFWAKIASLLITITGGCFLAYAGCFLVANLFSATTSPLLNSLSSASESDSTGGSTRSDHDSDGGS